MIITKCLQFSKGCYVRRVVCWHIDKSIVYAWPLRRMILFWGVLTTLLFRMRRHNVCMQIDCLHHAERILDLYQKVNNVNNDSPIHCVTGFANQIEFTVTRFKGVMVLRHPDLQPRNQSSLLLRLKTSSTFKCIFNADCELWWQHSNIHSFTY